MDENPCEINMWNCQHYAATIELPNPNRQIVLRQQKIHGKWPKTWMIKRKML
jgi:hypothetical protein